jgi:predicted amidohydrolase/ribosomal protein S18 acetylase RimI-like enzyme
MHKGKKRSKNKVSKQVKVLPPSPAATLAKEIKAKPTRKKRSHKLVLRHLTLDDFEDLKAIMDRVYADMGGSWTREQIASQLSLFPEGQICIENKGRVIAVALSLIVKYADWGDKHTYADITANGYITTHNPGGDTLYGIDLFVDPDFRDLRLGRRLYDARKEMCENLNLRAIVAGGRIPGYKHYAGKMSPRQYIELIKSKELHDPVLSFQLANDFHVRRVITDYEPLDRETKGYATLLEWINIYYEDKPIAATVGQAKEVVRIGAVQWQMRPVDSFADLMRQIEFFVDAVAGYKADFMLLPEFFGAPLMALAKTSDPAIAVRHLAEYGPRMREELQRLAVSYNVNIIAGSMPEYRDLELRNVSYLMRRDGTWDAQYKLHITPDEKAYWGVKGGDSLRVFNTDIGRIGILICYDVEFPELPRLLAEQGMSILFVPYWTDTKNAYLRLRHCAQARAIENECYVAITGSVGNLPNVENMDIQYSQAAILTPSDFSFPHDGVAAEATPNTETVLIADLDLSLLKELHLHGSVRNLIDRRLDLYDLSLQRK